MIILYRKNILRNYFEINSVQKRTQREETWWWRAYRTDLATLDEEMVSYRRHRANTRPGNRATPPRGSSRVRNHNIPWWWCDTSRGYRCNRDDRSPHKPYALPSCPCIGLLGNFHCSVDSRFYCWARQNGFLDIIQEKYWKIQENIFEVSSPLVLEDFW